MNEREPGGRADGELGPVTPRNEGYAPDNRALAQRRGNTAPARPPTVHERLREQLNEAYYRTSVFVINTGEIAIGYLIGFFMADKVFWPLVGAIFHNVINESTIFATFYNTIGIIIPILAIMAWLIHTGIEVLSLITRDWDEFREQRKERRDN